jgi:hypothetical protein
MRNQDFVVIVETWLKHACIAESAKLAHASSASHVTPRRSQQGQGKELVAYPHVSQCLLRRVVP